AAARESGSRDSAALAALVRVASVSRRLGGWLAARPEDLARLTGPRGPAVPVGPFRAVESARALLADLEGAPFPEVDAALSAMAGEAFQAMLAAERAALGAEAGEALDR